MGVINRITITQAPAATMLIRFIVGLVFFSEGVQKFVYPDEVGAARFAKIPIANAETVAPLIGGLEIVGGLMVLAGFLTRVAVLPLIAIMLTAILTTKIPILLGYEFMGFSLRKVPYYGVWGFLHESRTDLAMLFCSLYLSIVGAGRMSVDAISSRRALSDDVND